MTNVLFVLSVNIGQFLARIFIRSYLVSFLYQSSNHTCNQICTLPSETEQALVLIFMWIRQILVDISQQ